MVRAILEGRKTQTRRVVKPLKTSPLPEGDGWHCSIGGEGWGALYRREATGGVTSHPLPRCPYGVPGDRLYVREAHRFTHGGEDRPLQTVVYRATAPDDDGADHWGTTGRWRPSIHMPRWASRITLEVTGVRVERLQDITEDDARAEGVSPYANGEGFVDARSEFVQVGAASFRLGFEILWDEINGKRAPWSSNPWVWVVEFRKLGGSDAE